MAKARDKKSGLSAGNSIFALDIGTRSIIGMVGTVIDGKVKIIAVERAEHANRAMVDGQIENIDKVAALADAVKKKLEQRLHFRLERVFVAAAGRALKTKRASFELELPEVQLIDEEVISRLEAGAIGSAEEAFDQDNTGEGNSRRFFLVGYTVCQYFLDNYMMSSLKDHRGKNLKVDLIATFLPSEVVESLYTTMHKIGLEIAGLTLEPIAAINAAIPENLRLLNLVLVDIGAGTSDIAACKDGSITGYTMATVAGDEITEIIMKEYLVDFTTAESIKTKMESEEEIGFTDVLGFQQQVSKAELEKCIQGTAKGLCHEIANKVLEVNGSAPSALFLAGGGSRLSGLREWLIEELGMEEKRVAIAGNNFRISAFSDEYDLNNPEYATPLGIVISAGLNLINDGFRVILNGKAAKLFRSGSFTVLNLLMMNGYSYQDIMGRSGRNLYVTVNGKRKIFYSSPVRPAVLTINQEEGKLTEIVHAGDCIDFIPASHGVSASACLGDIEGAGNCIGITLNGDNAPLDTPLKNGDNILIQYAAEEKTEDASRADLPDAEDGAYAETAAAMDMTEAPAGEASRAAMANEPAAVTEMPADREADAAAGAQPVPVSGTASILGNAPVSGNASVSGTASAPGLDIAPKTAAPTSPTPKKEEERVIFNLNGMPLPLPANPDGKPYYLMDMLQYSGIDFDHIKGLVTLKVNGIPAPFQHPLKAGDHIEIVEETR